MVKIKKYWPISFASAAVIVAVAYAVWTQRSAGWFAEEDEVQVKVASAKKITIPVVAEGADQLQAGKETDVISPLPGVLEDVRVKVGDLVKTGQVVAVLQAKELLERAHANEKAVKAAAANLQEVNRQLEDIEEKLATTRELYRKDLIARRDVEEMEIVADTAKAEKQRAQAELAQREAALAQTRYLMGLTKIVAPATGIVTRRFAQPGASLAASAAIMSVAEPAMMRITIRLAAADAHLVHPGMAAMVRITALPETVFKGIVSNVKMAAESETHVATAEIQLPNPGGLLKPGMEASVSVPLAEEREVIVVPRAAVFDLQGKRCVYVVDGHRIRLRSITTEADQSADTVVTSNLAEGEKVVITGQNKLRSDSYVHIIE